MPWHRADPPLPGSQAGRSEAAAGAAAAGVWAVYSGYVTLVRAWFWEWDRGDVPAPGGYEAGLDGRHAACRPVPAHYVALRDALMPVATVTKGAPRIRFRVRRDARPAAGGRGGAAACAARSHGDRLGSPQGRYVTSDSWSLQSRVMP